MEEEMNTLFHSQHPQLPASLELTQIRKMKKRMLQVGMELSLNFCTIAYAYAFFERLILMGFVNRDNMKARAAVCMVLAAKFDHSSTSKTFLRTLLEASAKAFGVSVRDILKKELKVLDQLHFELMMRPGQLIPHCVRLYEKVATDEDTILRCSKREGELFLFTMPDS
eukprot:TRINITY_DN4150_c0_g1_i6.p1 TRINITY_DN4150_c0_g1~~TRINITY_DN4150_c0_g1_i6.p1  ORF type:complete len:168 (+),score=56.12 TRINITY_DN4150_c0_g1_i6:153-656(+)